MSRRGRGEGTVGREGDSWVARIDLPVGPDGKRRRRRRRARTKSEALQALKELRAEIEAVDDPDGLRRTVAQAVEHFLSTRNNVGRSEKTIEIDHSRARTIVRGLGNRKLGNLTVNDCDRFLADLAAGEYGRKMVKADTVRRHQALLTAAIRNEQRMGNVAKNVAELSELPRFTAPEVAEDDDGDSSTSVRRILTLGEYRRLHDACSGSLQILVDLCGRCGLRPSEARALRWSRVDLDDRTVRIDAQMSSANKLVAPKTRRSRRTVPIDDRTVELINAWSAAQEEKRTAAGQRWSNPHGLLVTSRYGSPYDASNLRKSLWRRCGMAGLDDYLPYELRHTAITFQLDQGAEMWEVSDWAGTSERMIELIYRHRTSRVSKLAPLPFGQDDR